MTLSAQIICQGLKKNAIFGLVWAGPPSIETEVDIFEDRVYNGLYF